MSKWNRPNDDCEVSQVIKDYIASKGWYVNSRDLTYLAEDCLLFWESRGWAGVKYWPAVVKRWVLTEQRRKNSLIKTKSPAYKPKGNTVRDKILKRKNNE